MFDRIRIGRLLAVVLAGAWAVSALAESQAPSANEAIKRLAAGNARFQTSSPTHPNSDAARRAETAKGQNPFAAVVACSDSRVPVELVFDQGIGDVFVVRIAGNVCGVSGVASVEYAVEHLHTPLLVVMGHTSCGAVTAAVEGAKLEGKLPDLMGLITPAVEAARKQNPSLKGKELVAAAILANVQHTIETLFEHSPLITRLVKEGKVKVVGALYDIESGKVLWLPGPGGEPTEPEPEPAAAKEPALTKQAEPAAPPKEAEPAPPAKESEPADTTEEKPAPTHNDMSPPKADKPEEKHE